MIAPEDLAAIAAAVAHELERRRFAPGAGSSLTVDDVAVRLSVTRDYVYRHARQLGGVKLPGGEHGQGRWRFPPERLQAALETATGDPPTTPARVRQSRSGRATRPVTNTGLLPIRGAGQVASAATTRKRPRANEDRRGPDQEI